MKPPSKITRKSSTQSSLNPSKSVPSGKLRVCELENGRWPSRNRRFSRENSMVGLSIVFSDCRNQRVKNSFSYGFPLVFLWFSHGFPMVFLWFSYGFPMVFPWFSTRPSSSASSGALVSRSTLVRVWGN